MPCIMKTKRRKCPNLAKSHKVQAKSYIAERFPHLRLIMQRPSERVGCGSLDLSPMRGRSVHVQGEGVPPYSSDGAPCCDLINTSTDRPTVWKTWHRSPNLKLLLYWKKNQHPFDIFNLHVEHFGPRKY